jgi:hypothetical protein
VDVGLLSVAGGWTDGIARFILIFDQGIVREATFVFTSNVLLDD